MPDVTWQVSDRAGTAMVTNHGPVWFNLGDWGKENNIGF